MNELRKSPERQPAATDLSPRAGPRGPVRWLAACRDLVLPPICAGCGEDLAGTPASGLLCDACCHELAPPPAAQCPRCAVPIPLLNRDQPDCAACRHDRFHFHETIALGVYEGALRRAVIATKGIGGAPLAAALASLLYARNRQRLRNWSLDGVVAVPTHHWRPLAAGQSSVAVMARELARRLGFRAWPLLVRRRPTPQQSTLPPTRRRRNPKRSIRSARGFSIKGARILLVDDVMTTGATAHESARVLREAGAACVMLAVLARGLGTQ